MDTTLNTYIKRADIISDSSSNSIRDANELLHMIGYLENTLEYIKEKYRSKTNKTLPDSIVYNADINQYEISIDHLKLRGNIGRIYDKKMLLDNNMRAHQLVKCNAGNSCKNILSQTYCKFWHDPLDLIKLRDNNKISDSFYHECIKYVRNFMNTSYLYTTDNKNGRLIGNLTPDDSVSIKYLKRYRDNLDNMKSQVARDILFLLELTKPDYKI